MVVSLLISITLWLYISSVDKEVITQPFRGVKVELVGENLLKDSKNMVVTDMDTSTVTVVLEGPRRIIGSWDADSITAQIDVSKLSRAAYTSQQYVISYPDGTDTSSISVVRKTPETINFMVSPQVSKTIQVRGSFDGKLADGYTAEMPVFEPSTIVISGAEAYIKNVSYAWVTFGEGEVDSTYKVETGFTLRDEDGVPCSNTGITFSTDVVTATLPVLDMKEVKLDVNLIEGAGATAANTKVTNLSYINVTEGYSANVISESLDVTLRGKEEVISQIKPENIRAVADLSAFNESTGTYMVPVKIYIDGFTDVGALKPTSGENSISIEIRKVS